VLVSSLGMTAALPAQAAIVDRVERLLPAENCQAALPAYDGNIRKRPLAVQNEGDGNAFVTCAMKGTFGAAAIDKEVWVRLINIGATATSITCTLVDGRNLALSDPLFLTRTALVPAGGSIEIGWAGADNGGNNYIYPAMSCGLPPRTGIRYTGRLYEYED